MLFFKVLINTEFSTVMKLCLLYVLSNHNTQQLKDGRKKASEKQSYNLYSVCSVDTWTQCTYPDVKLISHYCIAHLSLEWFVFMALQILNNTFTSLPSCPAILLLIYDSTVKGKSYHLSLQVHFLNLPLYFMHHEVFYFTIASD